MQVHCSTTRPPFAMQRQLAFAFDDEPCVAAQIETELANARAATANIVPIRPGINVSENSPERRGRPGKAKSIIVTETMTDDELLAYKDFLRDSSAYVGDKADSLEGAGLLNEANTIKYHDALEAFAAKGYDNARKLFMQLPDKEDPYNELASLLRLGVLNEGNLADLFVGFYESEARSSLLNRAGVVGQALDDVLNNKPGSVLFDEALEWIYTGEYFTVYCAVGKVNPDEIRARLANKLAGDGVKLPEYALDWLSSCSVNSSSGEVWMQGGCEMAP